MGSPENAFAPTVQLTPGLQGGIGSPLNPFATPNAVPNTSNNNPSMIFAFTCLSSAAVAAMRTDSKRKSALQVPQKAHPVCHNLRPIWESGRNNYYFQKISVQNWAEPLFSRLKPLLHSCRNPPNPLKTLEISVFQRIDFSW